MGGKKADDRETKELQKIALACGRSIVVKISFVRRIIMCKKLICLTFFMVVLVLGQGQVRGA